MQVSDKRYIQLEFRDCTPELSEILLARLSEIGFYGFEEGDDLLRAFIPEEVYDEQSVNSHALSLNVVPIKSTIRETNWNQLWESNFQPVIIEDSGKGRPWLLIRADFHEPVPDAEYELLITPKMSFGTGHHATTALMLQQMKEIEFSNKTVLDFGTGTGILSILAEKLGASQVLAIDNDEWSILNAKENLQRNNCTRVQISKDGFEPGDQFYDIILANINKNVILEFFPLLAKKLIPGGTLLVSGLLKEDENEISTIARNFSMTTSKLTEYNDWISIRYNN